jgi:PBP1b-binding outer membrane lipoprotein LpoB
VDPAGSRTITTVGGINIQDYANAADTMVSSLIDGVINTGKLEAPAGQPAMLAISRISNNTSQHVDTDMLVKKIRVALNKTGKVVTTTTMGLGGNAEDPLAQGIKQQTEFLQDKKNTRLPDYSLSGKIIEQRERAGDVRQSSFVFQLSLTSKDGVAVWEDEKTITKQGKRSTVGF